jgi:hypothetical protein
LWACGGAGNLLKVRQLGLRRWSTNDFEVLATREKVVLSA